MCFQLSIYFMIYFIVHIVCISGRVGDLSDTGALTEQKRLSDPLDLELYRPL